jgi:hypothetical protein
MPQPADGNDVCGNCSLDMAEDPTSLPPRLPLSKLQWPCGQLMCSECVHLPAAFQLADRATVDGLRCVLHEGSVCGPDCVVPWHNLFHWMVASAAPQEARTAAHVAMRTAIEAEAHALQQQAQQAQAQAQQQQTIAELLATHVRTTLEGTLVQRCERCQSAFGGAIDYGDCACMSCPAPCRTQMCALCSKAYTPEAYPDDDQRSIAAHRHVREECVYMRSVSLERTYWISAKMLECARARVRIDKARSYRAHLLDHGGVLGAAAAQAYDVVAGQVLGGDIQAARSTTGTEWPGVGAFAQLVLSGADVHQWTRDP